MAVGEIFLSAFIKVLFEKLASADLIMRARSAGIYSELSKWKHNLSQIQAVLVDVGQKHITPIAVQLWLNKLQHLAYEIDDVLDDLATEAMRRPLNQQSHASTSTSKVLKIIPNIFHDFKYGHDIASKLDKITTKLHDLVEEKNRLGLIKNIVARSNRSSKRPEETSLVDVSTIVGREADKNALLGKLLCNESCSQNFSVVSIVGMGGVGKTILAQALYNDNIVKDHFELLAWACVSEEFDLFKITKIIYKSLGGFEKSFVNLNLLQVGLMEQLSNKRFLLVLDDVWNEDYDQWKLLQRPFLVGAPGSKILVTTRNTRVASIMGSIHPYNLGTLSDEDAMSIFAHYALNEQNFDSRPDLKVIAEGFIKKCGGLPLALIANAMLLRRKTDVEVWEEVLNRDIGNLEDRRNILPALRLSYDYLPGMLKQLFAYCSFFPSDHVFQKDELVLLWMAEEFLYQSDNIKSMEEYGRECFEELLSMSFFLHSTNDNQYIMHNLMHNLAKDVGGELFFTLDFDKRARYESEALDKVRYLSFVRQRFGSYREFKALLIAGRLRTLLAVSASLDGRQKFFLSNKVLTKIIPQLQFLRVLNLCNYSITEIPQSIGSLKHIRYLNFSRTDITCLPEQVGDLYNLQSLLLRGCEKLFSLPKNLVNLSKLRHLDISDTPRLNKMPLGIGELKDLQTLSKVIIEEIDGFKISELKGLLDLRGRLSIVGLHNVKDMVNVQW